MKSIFYAVILMLSGVAQADSFSCAVTRILDGDSLKCRPTVGREISVRIANIDAPEKAQPFGYRSKQALSDLCFGERAAVSPQAVDRYGRTVASVVCRGSRADAYQVRSGMAWVFDRYVTDRSLYPLQERARASALGLWSDAAPEPPWLWRRVNRRPARQP